MAFADRSVLLDEVALRFILVLVSLSAASARLVIFCQLTLKTRLSHNQSRRVESEFSTDAHPHIAKISVS